MSRVAIMGSFRSGRRGVGDGAHLADRVHLGKRVFHEVAGAQVEHIRADDLVELLFEIVKADYGAGAAGLVGSDAAECNHILGPRILHRGRDRVAHTIRIAERIGAGGIGWNHDVGRIGLVEGFGESPGVGDIGDERLRTFRRERL